MRKASTDFGLATIVDALVNKVDQVLDKIDFDDNFKRLFECVI